MNFSEGTRRLALLVGGVGAAAGGLGSYLELKNALQQKAAHDRFERLAASDDVTKERKCRLLGGAAGCSLDLNADIEAIAEPVASKDKMSSFREIWEKATPETQEAFLRKLNSTERAQFAMDMGWAPKQSQTDPYANLPDSAILHWTPPPSELNGKEIKTINWGEGKDYTVESIETEDGNTLYATSLPSRWMYLWVFILPIAGFVTPWGLIRSVQWVGAGFFVNKESNSSGAGNGG